MQGSGWTGREAGAGPPGSSMRIGSPVRTSPPSMAILMSPALRMNLSGASRASVAAIKPG